MHSAAIKAIVAATVLSVSGLLYYYLLYKRKYGSHRWTAAFPTPDNFHWLYGSLKGAKGRVGLSRSHESCAFEIEQLRKLGNCVFWATPLLPLIRLTRPADIRRILEKDQRKGLLYEFLKDWLGIGLLINYGPDWKRKRRLITPSFHFEILKEFAPIFAKNTASLINSWLQETDKRSKSVVVDMQIASSLLSLDNIGETAMGVQFGCLSNKDSDFLRATIDIARLNNLRALNPLLHNDLLYYRTANGRLNLQNMQLLHKYSGDAVRERKRLLDSGAAEIKQKFFIDILLTATDEGGQQLSFDEMRAEVDTFMFEGHGIRALALAFITFGCCSHRTPNITDTTSSGIMWILYDIANNDAVQTRVLQELRDVLGDDGAAHPTYQQIPSLHYLNMVVLESNRLHPPVPKIGRYLQDDWVFGIGHTAEKAVVPAGNEVGISIMGLHHQPDLWPDPDWFDPERFSEENRSKRGPYDYVPFSAGPRNCIGQSDRSLSVLFSVSWG